MPDVAFNSVSPGHLTALMNNDGSELFRPGIIFCIKKQV
jgi:hypothetical protein